MTSGLIDQGSEGVNTPEFSVSEIAGAVKRTVEGAFGHVRVRGEVGRVSRPRSGHIYLDLKDDRAVLSGVIWKNVAGNLSNDPEEGMEVVATGRLTTFAGQSKYQIVIESLAPAGLGALMAMLEKRRAALAAEGLFDAGRKRPLPFLPRTVGVVTSPSGAVIRDILHRIAERCPVRVIVWPVAVQGSACAGEVAAALRGFSALPEGGALPRPDVVIVARGGGSVEDLWGFNEEIVVRAAAESAIPVISAVGHETDVTLIDHAADRRAPTPTAAAEMAVPVKAELAADLAGWGARLARSSVRLREGLRQRLSDRARRLPRPDRLLSGAQQRLDSVALRLPPAWRLIARPAERLAQLEGRRRPSLGRILRLRARDFDRVQGRLTRRWIDRPIQMRRGALDGLFRRLVGAEGQAAAARRLRLDGLGRLLAGLGYRETLARGFAVVRQGGDLVTRLGALDSGHPIEIEFADGRADAALARRPARPRRPTEPPEGQGSLF